MEFDAALSVLDENTTDRMIIYMLKNKFNGKMYIGKTKHSWKVRKKMYERDILNLKKKSLILRALRKYRWEGFDVYCLHRNVGTLLELANLEKNEIKKWNSFNTGYNMTVGGDGGCSKKTAKINSIRMKKTVKSGNFILQRPEIKERARLGASISAKLKYTLGVSNFQKPDARKKAIEKHMQKCNLKICRAETVIFDKIYNSKKDILKDGFPLNILQHLRKKNTYKVNFNPWCPTAVYKKDDIITLTLLR